MAGILDTLAGLLLGGSILTDRFNSALRTLPPPYWKVSYDTVGQKAVTRTYSQIVAAADPLQVEMEWIDADGVMGHKLTAKVSTQLNRGRLIPDLLVIDGVEVKGGYIALGYRFQFLKPLIVVAEFKFNDGSGKAHDIRFDATPFVS